MINEVSCSTSHRKRSTSPFFTRGVVDLDFDMRSHEFQTLTFELSP